ncbi:MAG: hypothetical protein ACR2LV_08480 [Solirubrobacteraceae bacterium]
MANVAALTFLAARAVPLGWTVAIAGGVPLARVAERDGARAGYAAAGASLVETMSIMGPARMGIPIPHAASAPWLGALAGRRKGFLVLALAGSLVRLLYYGVTSTISILLIVGLDAYLGTYQHVRHLVGILPAGRSWALILTAVATGAWSLGAGLIQAWVIRRGLRRWSQASAGIEAPAPAADPGRPAPPRRAGTMVLVALAGFAAALASTDPRAIGALSLALAVVWFFTRAGTRDLLRGLALAAPLALSTFGFGAFGGIGTEMAAQRAARVTLLVLIAVWVRAAAGSEGLRDVSLRVVRRLARFPALGLAAAVLGASAGIGDYGQGARRLGRCLGAARRRPVAVVDAALSWVAEESVRRGRSAPPVKATG